MPPLSDSLADVSDLRRFGLALTCDDRFVLDHAAASALVERLFRQASMEAVDAGQGRSCAQSVDARVRAFAQFVRLYRRHVRRLSLDEHEAGWDENAEKARSRSRNGEIAMAAAVRMLPSELREALLIVVLASFTHQEAAAALDISLATLIARLTKARDRIAGLTRAGEAADAIGPPMSAAPHLRVVK